MLSDGESEGSVKNEDKQSQKGALEEEKKKRVYPHLYFSTKQTPTTVVDITAPIRHHLDGCTIGADIPTKHYHKNGPNNPQNGDNTQQHSNNHDSNNTQDDNDCQNDTNNNIGFDGDTNQLTSASNYHQQLNHRHPFPNRLYNVSLSQLYYHEAKQRQSIKLEKERVQQPQLHQLTSMLSNNQKQKQNKNDTDINTQAQQPKQQFCEYKNYNPLQQPHNRYDYEQINNDVKQHEFHIRFDLCVQYFSGPSSPSRFALLNYAGSIAHSPSVVGLGTVIIDLRSYFVRLYQPPSTNNNINVVDGDNNSELIKMLHDNVNDNASINPFKTYQDLDEMIPKVASYLKPDKKCQDIIDRLQLDLSELHYTPYRLNFIFLIPSEHSKYYQWYPYLKYMLDITSTRDSGGNIDDIPLPTTDGEWAIDPA
jgi:hypothetical protein